MKNFPISFLTVLAFFVAGQLFSSCSSSQPFYLSKGTGSFSDPYKSNQKHPAAKSTVLTADALTDISLNDLSALNQAQIIEALPVDNSGKITQKTTFQKLSRQQIKQLKKRLEVVLDTTKKRDRVTIRANEKRVNDLKKEAENLKNSVKAEKDGDKVVVSFDKPQTNLSTEAKILIIVVAALLLVGLLSLPVIGTVLGIVLGIAVVAAALALLLGIVEIS